MDTLHTACYTCRPICKPFYTVYIRVHIYSKYIPIQVYNCTCMISFYKYFIRFFRHQDCWLLFIVVPFLVKSSSPQLVNQIHVYNLFDYIRQWLSKINQWLSALPFCILRRCCIELLNLFLSKWIPEDTRRSTNINSNANINGSLQLEIIIST